MDNRGLAADCYGQALQCDVNCFEAFDSLIQHHMLTATEGIIVFINIIFINVLFFRGRSYKFTSDF